MGIAFLALSVVLYLALVVDWKELMGVMRQGGWPAIAIYFIVTLLIVYAIACPVAVRTAGHH